MKNPFFVVSVIAIVYSTNQLYAQQKLTVKNMEGVWQYGSASVGDQLNQNFVFFNNSNFTFHNGKHGDDIVSTLNLKGKYRLDKDKMYFTIASRMTIDRAKIGIVNPWVDFGIFEYEDATPKEITEEYPKEIADPATITIITPNHIKINDEDYYKVSSNPNEVNKL